MIRVSMTPGFRHGLLCVATSTLAVSLFASTAAAQVVTLQPRPGDPLPGLTFNEVQRFFLGKDAFMHPFTPEEGLGPAFNQNSCSACHIFPVVGGSGGIAVTRFGIWDAGFTEFDPLAELGGSLFQMGAIVTECVDEIPDPADFPDHIFVTTQRITNSSLGLGLVEAIPDADILANEGTIAGGFAHMVTALEDETNTPRVGRMGWKAQVPTVLTFSADAARNELGISNRLEPLAPPPQGDWDLLAWCEDLEGINDQALHPNDQPNAVFNVDGVEFIDRITDFQRFASPPPQTPKSGMTGEQIFMDIGCGQCHVPSYTTPNDPALEEALRNKAFRPYSDFLLQNMGALGDQIVQGDAGPRHFRTPNLWGVRDRDPLLHDGRVGGGTLADRIADAVDWHDVSQSAARPAAQAYKGLSASDQQLVINFLDSLGRREFDFIGDNFVHFFDVIEFVNCYTGPDQTYLPANYATSAFPSSDPQYQAMINEMDHPCAVFDVNQDNRVDLIDFMGLLQMYDDSETHCQLWDYLDNNIAGGVPIPPGCEGVCAFDLNGDGEVSGFDLLVLLSAWGNCSDVNNCPADLNGDGVVNGHDLLMLLGGWGPCPEPESNSEMMLPEVTFVVALAHDREVSLTPVDAEDAEITESGKAADETSVSSSQPSDVQSAGSSGSQSSSSRAVQSSQRAIDRQ